MTPAYFQTLGIPLVAGRFFTVSDDSQTHRLVIVNQSLARRFWPKSSAIGQHLT